MRSRFRASLVVVWALFALSGSACSGSGGKAKMDEGGLASGDGGGDGSRLTDPSEPSSRRLPKGCAESLDNATAVGFYEAVRCIFEGADPVQKGVAEDLITPERVAVLRGVVRDRDGEPLPGVRVRVLRSDEYGETTTGAGGTYDLAVNGGGQVTLCFEKEGFMRVQRHREVPHRRFVPFPGLVMTQRNAVAGEVSLDGMAAPTLVRGPMESDDDGERSHAVLFAPGTRAMAKMPSGQSVELSSLSVRVTEFTVGDRGPEAMPGDLPANSGYTYAVDLSVDEAEAMGAAELVFDPPTPMPAPGSRG